MYLYLYISRTREAEVLKTINCYSEYKDFFWNGYCIRFVCQRYVKSSSRETLFKGRGKYVPSLNIKYGRLAFWGGRPFPCRYFNPSLSCSVAISSGLKFKFEFIYSHSFNYNTTTIRKKEVKTKLTLHWIKHKKVKMCLAAKRAKLSSWLLQLSLGFVYIFFSQ